MGRIQKRTGVFSYISIKTARVYNGEEHGRAHTCEAVTTVRVLGKCNTSLSSSVSLWDFCLPYVLFWVCFAFAFGKNIYEIYSVSFLRERERERESMNTSREGAEREGERESQAGSTHTVSTQPNSRLDPMNLEIMT